MVRMTPLMAERLRTYAEAKGCSSSVVIRCPLHAMLLNERIDFYSHLPQPLPSSS